MILKEIRLVYCTKCGKENEEGATFCVNCGGSLYPRERRETEEKQEKDEDCFGRGRREDECFGLPQGGAIAGLIVGTIIIIIGLGIYLGVDIWSYIGPFMIIIVGILIVMGTIYGLTRRQKR